MTLGTKSPLPFDLEEAIRLSLATSDFFWEVEFALWVYLRKGRPGSLVSDYFGGLHECEIPSDDSLRHSVGLLGKIRIEIYSKEHAPPHFHVTGPKIDATFRVDDGSFIHGEISNKLKRRVEDFFAKHKKRIVAIWNSTRPDGCPVGYVFDETEA